MRNTWWYLSVITIALVIGGPENYKPWIVAAPLIVGVIVEIGQVAWQYKARGDWARLIKRTNRAHDKRMAKHMEGR